MTMIQKVLGFLFLFALSPLCTGLLWRGKLGKREEGIWDFYLPGFLTQLAAFQVIAVPVMILDAYGMDLLVTLSCAALTLLAAGGLLRAVFAARKKEAPALIGFSACRAALRKMTWECRIYWLIVLAAVLFQMYMAYTRASFDGDDAYYVVQSVLADQTGVLNRIRPYTGLSTDLDIRHALAALPLWEALVARLTGVHATIVAHTLLPLVLIPLTYFVYGKIGAKLLGAEGWRLPAFLILVNILQIFGNTSIYTNATFFLMRTWQGKSVMANLILLALIWLFLEILDDKTEGAKNGFWILMALTNVAAAMMTSMGAFLAGLFLGIVSLVAALRKKKPSLLGRTVLCCIPNAVFLVMLLVMG